MPKLIVIEPGTVINGLTVVRQYRGEKYQRLVITCHCGKEFDVDKNSVMTGNTKSCGCSKIGNTNGVKHGLSKTTSYNSWKKMMSRCYDPSHPDFPNYGARGITVCEKWHTPEGFTDDMGVRAKNLSIERIDVNGNYEPRNCCWIPLGMQSKNRRDWQHTEEGRKAISESRKSDWQRGVYDSKVEAQRKK